MDVEEQSDVPPPGEVLRTKRKELNISVDEVAKQLHLETRFVEALERDDYAELPAAIYVRGYIRAYAKFVDIDGDRVIDLFNARVSEPPPEILPEVKYHTQVSSSDKPVKAVTYLVTLSLVILVLIWYRSHYRITDVGALSDEPKVLISEPAFDYEFVVVEHPPGWRHVIAGEDSNTSEATAPPQTFTPRIDTSRSGPDELKMLILETSWIEISDSTGKDLFVSTGKVGEEIIVSGNAPFEILFGYAPGVKLFYKNRPFDIAPYVAESGVARFRVTD